MQSKGTFKYGGEVGQIVKSLIHSSSCSGERGLAENIIWGEGLAKNVRLPSYGQEGV